MGYRAVRLGAVGVTIERADSGRITIRTRDPLSAYPPRITDKLLEWAQKAPERTFVAKRDAQGVWQRLSYGAALQRARRVAAALLTRGLSAERPLMILSENDHEHALLALAALHAGIPYVPVSPAYSLISRDYGRLREAVALMTPGLVFAANGELYGRAISAAIPRETEVVLGQGALPERAFTQFCQLEAVSAGPELDRAHRAITSDSICKFLMTSGSTGTPKAVIQTQGMLTSNQQMIADTLTFLTDEPPVIVDWLPWHHTFGGNHNFGLTLYHGGTLYIDEGKPTPVAFGESLRNLAEISPTVYFNVPRGFEELARALERDRALAARFFARVKVLFYAAAGLSQRTWDALERLAEETCGERIVMLTGLGMTETSPFALSAHWLAGRSGGVGIPAPGVELRLEPVGHKLEARYRGPSVTPGFWRADELNRRAFDADGFYCSGDAVTFADASRPELGLLFDGRLAEDFKLDSGTWVSVGPLRARVIAAGSPYVQDVVVTGQDRAELGLLIVPDVQACRKLTSDLSSDASVSEVLSHAATRAYFRELLQRLALTATGSATRIVRALLLAEPLSLDRGEVTDKGSVVQQAVLRNRAALVERLYSPDAAHGRDEVLELPS